MIHRRFCQPRARLAYFRGRLLPATATRRAVVTTSGVFAAARLWFAATCAHTPQFFSRGASCHKCLCRRYLWCKTEVGDYAHYARRTWRGVSIAPKQIVKEHHLQSPRWGPGPTSGQTANCIACTDKVKSHCGLVAGGCRPSPRGARVVASGGVFAAARLWFAAKRKVGWPGPWPAGAQVDDPSPLLVSRAPG